MQAAIASVSHAPDGHRQKRRAGKRSASFVTIIDPSVSIVQWIGGLQAKSAIAAGH
jgi:hypothetical protein